LIKTRANLVICKRVKVLLAKVVDYEKDNITHLKKWVAVESACACHKQKIRKNGDLPYITAEKLEDLVDEFVKFPVGQHILLTGGASGAWTDYMICYPWAQKDVASKMLALSRMEYFLIFESLSVVAQRELFLRSQKEAQKHVKEGCTLLSLPCGVMRDLLTLDFSGAKDYTLIGVDLDPESLNAAQALANELNISNTQLIQDNAWEFILDTPVDFINSIGLNVYVSDRKRVTALYRQFYQALKPGGVLFTGVLTYPPEREKESDWKMSLIPPHHYEMEKILVDDILELHFENYRTMDEIREDFIEAGFSKVEIIPDQRCIFPAVIATK
jgi:SAM-dependent methyltransferase